MQQATVTKEAAVREEATVQKVRKKVATGRRKTVGSSSLKRSVRIWTPSSR